MKIMVAEIINKFKIIPGFLLAGVLVFGFSSCKKDNLDPDYPFTITVKTHADSLSMPNVFVEAYAPIPNTKVFFEGYTNESGTVSFEHGKPAVLEVRATRGEKSDLTWIGCTEIRLEAETEVNKTVYIKPYDPQVVGCAL